MIRLYRVIRTGIQDGYEQPSDLTGGVTYENNFWNTVYDVGVNVGQVVGAWVKGELLQRSCNCEDHKEHR